MGSQVVLVKGNRQMGFQVDRATHKFWLNEVVKWDLRLMEKKNKQKNKQKKK